MVNLHFNNVCIKRENIVKYFCKTSKIFTTHFATYNENIIYVWALIIIKYYV